MFIDFLKRNVKQVPLRTVILVPLLTIIIIGVGSTSLLIFFTGKKAVNDLATRLEEQAKSMIQNRIEDIFKIPQRITEQNFNAIKSGQLDLKDLTDQKTWYPHLLTQIQSFDSIGTIGFGRRDSAVVYIQKQQNGAFLYAIKAPGLDSLKEYPINKSGKIDIARANKSIFITTERPWYKKPAEAKKPTWIDIYKWKKRGKYYTIGNAYGYPYLSPDSTSIVEGVLLAEFSLPKLNDLLKRSMSDVSAHFFIMDTSGFLVATSFIDSLQKLYNVVEDGKDIKRFNVMISEDSLFRKTVKELVNELNLKIVGDSLSNLNIKSAVSFNFVHQGQRHYAQVTPLKNTPGVKWYAVIIIPEDEIMKQIKKSTIYAISGLLLIFLFLVWFSSSISKRIAKPVSQRKQALADFGTQLGSKIIQGEAKILDFVNNQAKKFMDTDNMYIALYNESEDEVRFPLAFKGGEPITIDKRRTGKGRTEEIIRTGKSIFLLTRKESVKWYEQPGRKEYIGDPLASWIGVPMKVGEKVLGVIATYHPTKDYVYSKDDLEILQAMANQLAIALENARHFEEEKWAYLGRIAGSIAHRIGNKGGMVRVSVMDLAEYLENIKVIDKKITNEINTIIRNNEYLLRLSDYLFKPQKAVREGLEKIDVILHLDDALRYAEIPNNITVERKFAKNLPKVLGNKYLVEVFLELIVNSIEAMSMSGEKKLIISGNQKDNRVEIKFEDTGAGITPENEKFIFELFSTSAEKKLNQESHKGFGLWWVSTFLNDIGGEIRYEQSPNNGAIFIVELIVAEK